MPFEKRSRKTQSFVTRIVDKETGEILAEEISEKKHFYVVDTDKPNYYFTYKWELNVGLMEERLIRYLCLNMKYNTNFVSFDRLDKDQFCSFFKYSTKSVARALKNIQKDAIIIFLHRGCYMVNPEYFWKGETKHRPSAWEYFEKEKKRIFAK
jgi:hypothetical protein